MAWTYASATTITVPDGPLLEQRVHNGMSGTKFNKISETIDERIQHINT